MIRFHSALTPFMVPAEEVRPDPRNANNGDTDAIIESITVNGCYRPIYAARESGTIVAGHHVYAALLEMGAQMVPVCWVDGDTEQATRILLGDNEIARLAWLDLALELDLLDYLERTEKGLAGTGFTPQRVEDLRLMLLNQSGFAVPDIPPDGLPHRCPECHHQWYGPCSDTEA